MSWRGYRFSFEGAVFDCGDFTKAHFRRVTFAGAKTSFKGAVFSAGRVDFDDVRFSAGTVEWGPFPEPAASA